jgi:transcription elongation GreA/GreB family factor
MASVTKAQLEQLLDETRKEVQETVKQLQVLVRDKEELERRYAKLELKFLDVKERLYFYRGHTATLLPDVFEKEQQFDEVEG